MNKQQKINSYVCRTIATTINTLARLTTSSGRLTRQPVYGSVLTARVILEVTHTRIGRQLETSDDFLFGVVAKRLTIYENQKE